MVAIHGWLSKRCFSSSIVVPVLAEKLCEADYSEFDLRQLIASSAGNTFRRPDGQRPLPRGERRKANPHTARPERAWRRLASLWPKDWPNVMFGLQANLRRTLRRRSGAKDMIDHHGMRTPRPFIPPIRYARGM